MFVTYPYRNYLSRYAAGFVDTERREGPESLATVPISVARPGRGAGGRRAAGPALGTSRMQFTNTSDATLQTDTNQHNAGGELHATLPNNEPYRHTRPHPMGGRRGADQRCKASPRGPEGLAEQRVGAPPHTAPQAPPVWRAPEGPEGQGGQHTDNERRPIGGRRGPISVGGPGRGAGGWRRGQGGPRDRPFRAKLACGDLAGGPPPTGTHSGPAQHSRPRGGRKSVGTAGHAAAGDLSGQQDTRRPEHQRGNKQRRTSSGATTTRSRPAPQGPGGSRFRPLGGCQRLFQRIWVPSEPRRWQASTTRAAMPASADLPHVRGSYCFFTPTSPSILRTPS